MCCWSSCCMILTSLSFNFLNCKIRIAAVTNFIRQLWGLNELIKWISSWIHSYLQLLRYSIQFCDLIHYIVTTLNLYLQSSLSWTQNYISNCSFRSSRRSIKYLKLNIFKPNSWSSSEQTFSTCSCAFHSWRQFPPTSSSDQNPQSHSWLTLHMQCIRKFYQLYFFQSVQNLVSFLHFHWSKPLSDKYCCNSLLLPPLTLTPKSILHMVADWFLLQCHSSVQNFPMSLHLSVKGWAWWRVRPYVISPSVASLTSFLCFLPAWQLSWCCLNSPILKGLAFAISSTQTTLLPA